jgi:hypothetical protein
LWTKTSSKKPLAKEAGWREKVASDGTPEASSAARRAGSEREEKLLTNRRRETKIRPPTTERKDAKAVSRTEVNRKKQEAEKTS